MLCHVCASNPPDGYRVCRPCKDVLVRLPFSRRSAFIEEMVAGTVDQRYRIRLRWRDKNRREFYPDNLPG